MIPKFPEFKKLELSDQGDIEKISSQYPPYSDFNFGNIWAWDIHGNVRISALNNNLIILLDNFRTEKKVYSFLGNHQLPNTLENLFSFLDENNNIGASVGFVPEDSIKGIDLNKYTIEIDFNACDYIYDLEQLATYPGNKFSKKRKRLTTFLHDYRDITTRIIDLSNEQIKNSILGLVYHWAQGKDNDEDISLLLSREYRAINRFLNISLDNSVCLGVYNSNKLVGFNIMLVLPNKESMGLFIKYDKTFVGINEFIMRDSAEYLLRNGCDYVNGQEDLGITGLRISKNSYNPIKMLRKYTIKPI